MVSKKIELKNYIKQVSIKNLKLYFKNFTVD